MSRVGNAVITLPAGTSVTDSNGLVTVKGPKGELVQQAIKHTGVAVDDGVLRVTRDTDSKTGRANHGLMRALLNNMVTGVSVGFTKKLEVNGIGYRADVKGSTLVLNLGYSHPVNFPIPNGITITSDKNNVVSVSGIDKQQVCQVAANIRGFRKPDSYKGKGVRYVGEYVRLKAGKSA
jgi:large subunit ribosomal protein L6